MSHPSDQIHHLILSGAAYQRGLTHGKTLKDQIHKVVDLWKVELQHGLEMDPDEAINRFVARTDYVAAMRQWTPDLLQEIRGIAEGAQLPFETMLAFQLVDEFWNNAEVIFGEQCSSLGMYAQPGTPAYLAQNMDVEAFRDGFQVLLNIHYPDSDLECLVLTCAGLIGFNGLNNRGVGICCNALMQLNCRGDGLPVACVLRGALQHSTAQAAIDFIQDVPHASGQNYLVGGPGQLLNLECSANSVTPYQQEQEDLIWHTNHPLANDDYTSWFQELLEKGESYNFLDNSRHRYQSLQQQLNHNTHETRLEQIKSILRSKDSTEHPICVAADAPGVFGQAGMFTFGSTIMVLSDEPELYLTFGPPDTADYQRFGF